MGSCGQNDVYRSAWTEGLSEKQTVVLNADIEKYLIYKQELKGDLSYKLLKKRKVRCKVWTAEYYWQY